MTQASETAINAQDEKAVTERPDEHCPNAPADDPGHCHHWGDCEPCCRCGDDTSDLSCDCPKHSRMRRTMYPHQIARVVHEANRAVQVEQADETIPVSPHWDDLDDETKASALDGVRGVLDGHTPEQSHENWARFKADNGWTLGPIKDETTKQHPLLVPYTDLPESQKVKDDLFVAIVKALSGAR